MDNLISAILDNECDPQNPYIIKLHCKELAVFWSKVRPGEWINNDTIWIPGVYVYSIVEGNGWKSVDTSHD